MKKRKIKKKPIIILCLIIILNTSLILLLPDKKNHTKEKKVSEKEIKVNYTKDSLEKELKKEKYYIDKNLKRYIQYQNKNSNLSLSKIISNVNTNLDKTKYEDTIKTNLSKDSLVLVNKYYFLDKNYVPDDLISLKEKYNTGKNNKLKKQAADAFMEMSDAATLDNIIIKNASAYRSYEYQVNLYNDYVSKDGKDAADTYSARPGFSEHQTGLATDINEINSSFESTDAFKWLDKNAHKYGFILRFPKDKEDITGYQYESWHYRYVGKKVAKLIKDNNLTLEEYYAYYVEN